MPFRFAYENFVPPAGTVLSALSVDPAAPLSWLRDQAPGKRSRAALGWTIGAGFNDSIDVLEGATPRVATIVAATYATGTALAAAAQTALNAMSGAVNTYAVTYDVGTHKFTIARASGAASVSLLWATGANAPGSRVARTFGFTKTDRSASTSYVADVETHQGPQWIKVDLGAAAGVRAVFALGHNAAAGADFTLEAHSSDAWSAPSLSQALAGDARLRLAYLPVEQAFRWWRLVVDDVENPDGFLELGVWYLGLYKEPLVSHGMAWTEARPELSGVEFADQGAHYQDLRPRRRAWELPWTGLVQRDRDLFRAVADACPRGRCFFLTRRTQDPIETTRYGFLAGELSEEYIPGATEDYYSVPGFRFEEAL